MHNLEKTTTKIPDMNSKSDRQVQNAEKIYNIRHIENFNQQSFLVATHELIPLRFLRLDLSHYNLFVVSEKIKESGTFSLQDSELLKNERGKKIITPQLIKKSLKYPSIIASVNDDFLTATDSHIAFIGLVFAYEHSGNHTKFWYTSSVQYKQQLMNTNPDRFSIANSEQTNELDYSHWEIKNLNLLKVLGLEEEYNSEE